MKIRRASWFDAVNLIRWLLGGAEKNALDPMMLNWTTDELKVFVAENERGVHAMVPAHNSVTLESLALNPESTPAEKLQAVSEAVKAIAFEARGARVKQMNFISSDERTDESAMRQLGFSK